MNLVRRARSAARLTAAWILHTHPAITATAAALASATLYLLYREPITEAYGTAITWLTDRGPLALALPILGTAAILTATIALAMRGSRHGQ